MHAFPSPWRGSRDLEQQRRLSSPVREACALTLALARTIPTLRACFGPRYVDLYHITQVSTHISYLAASRPPPPPRTFSAESHAANLPRRGSFPYPSSRANFHAAASLPSTSATPRRPRLPRRRTPLVRPRSTRYAAREARYVVSGARVHR